MFIGIRHGSIAVGLYIGTEAVYRELYVFSDKFMDSIPLSGT